MVVKMLIKPSRWTEEDIKETQCKVWYIIKALQNNNYNKKITFEDLIWVISKLNTYLFDKYLISGINVEVFNMIEFDNIISARLYKPKGMSSDNCMQYLSEVEIYTIDKLAKHWKIYAKYLINLKK